MIRLSLPLSKSEQSHMTLVDCLLQVWHDGLCYRWVGISSEGKGLYGYGASAGASERPRA